MKHWMFNCKKVTYLVSESLDHKLPFYQRLGIRLHLFMCEFCSRYREQLFFLRKTFRLYAETPKDLDLSIKLSPEAEEQIKQSISNILGKHE